MLLAMAWRHILRQRRHSLITLILSMLTTTLFIFYVGMMEGSYAKIFKDSAHIYPGFIQATAPKFRDTPTYDYFLENRDALIERIESVQGVARVTPRVETFVLAASDENAIGALCVGIDPLKEPKVSTLFDTLKEGRLLEPTDTHAVLIGATLAKRLGITLGGSFSILGTAMDESFAAETLTVVGIFQSGLRDFDEAVFLNLTAFDALFLSHDRASTLVIDPDNYTQSASVAQMLSSQIDEVVIEDWRVYLSTLVDAMRMDRISGMMMLWLFIVLIFFVVAIYSYLSITARTREAGVMRALGTKPSQIMTLFFLEALILGGISALLGGMMGGLIIYYLELYPITLESMEEAYKAYGFIEATLPTHFSWAIVLEGVGYIALLNIACALYPAWLVVRPRPIDAMHHL
ncbi:MAG: hypothetical protein KU37_09130 [Sulfuricurvum sp. PC08-66]|nr:MAG: hypothetical protein KU37_09130 [Sulfuricurvum sp. PC08-66]